VLVNDATENLLIFSTTTNLKCLCDVDTIYVDGTFKYCAQYFCQLFTLHGIVNGHYIPLVFCLLKNKEYTTYLNAFKAIAQKCAEIESKTESERLKFEPRVIFADFEESIQKAVCIMWPNSTLKGCRFHLAQSWFRKIQKLGLSNDYKDKTSNNGKINNKTL
jgi:hypothetical protein